MSIREIRKIGDPVLREICQPVTRFDGEIIKLVQDLKDTMYAAPGVGLAANQIGVPLRVAVVDISVGDDPSSFIVLINPEIIYQEGEQYEEEGCLSIPGVSEKVKRPKKVRLKFQDLEGNFKEMEGEGLLARAFCHEIDHLNGKFFIDYLSPFKLKFLKGKLEKIQKSV
ncbi:MAG: peptide deformylase [Thermoanaerobaculia bacterium]